MIYFLSRIHFIQIFLSKWDLFPVKLGGLGLFFFWFFGLFGFFFHRDGTKCKVSLPKMISSLCQNWLLSPLLFPEGFLGLLVDSLEGCLQSKTDIPQPIKKALAAKCQQLCRFDLRVVWHWKNCCYVYLKIREVFDLWE